MFDGEPTFEELMSDPIVHAVMKADRVDISQIHEILPVRPRRKSATEASTPRCSSRGWAF